jgi:aryl-alcohol dehydrogenase-like predicted oxidoreductase
LTKNETEAKWFYKYVKMILVYFRGVVMLPKRFSRIVLGTAPFGTGISRDASFAVLDAFMGAGGNFIDTAAVYGMGASEQTVGEWMKDRGDRDRIFISTKGGHPSLPDWRRRITEKDIRGDIENSLRCLQTDFVDVYFLHRDDESLPVDVIMPVLDKLVKEGKTRYIGASNWTVERINEANTFARMNGMAEFAVSQIFWCGAVINKEGVYDQTLTVMDDKEHAGYAKNGMPVMAYTSQGKGLFSLIRDNGYERLSDSMKRTYINPETKARAERIFAVSEEIGVSPSVVSLAYLLYDKNIKAYPIIGTSRPERIAEVMKVLSLEKREIERLFSII